MAVNKKQGSRVPSGKPQKRFRDSYGCADWQPSVFPNGKDKESLELKRNWLQQEYPKKDRDGAKVREYMKLTYISQRSVIIKQPAVSLMNVKEQWPFLFEQIYLLDHFQHLVGHDTKTVFMDNITSKGKTIMSFMEDNKVSKRWRNWLKVLKISQRHQKELNMLVHFAHCQTTLEKRKTFSSRDLRYQIRDRN